jgi:hypothetical protein
MSAAPRLQRRGQAYLEHLGLPVPPVLYRRWARMVAAGLSLAGSPCRFVAVQ